ncbi:MAG: thioredoxin family protein [Phycisphaerae bacterium]|nr:thioredoxin family protein [Phycisphaerae bacterium]
MSRSPVSLALMVVLLSCMTTTSLQANDGLDGTSWSEDYAAALATAKKTGRPVLVDFTGSDWCGWCIKLKGEVFTKADFQAWAKKNVVLLEIDFPQRKKQTDEVRKQNRDLQKKYGVRGFPTILFLDAEGKVVGKSGYMPGGPAPWIKHAQAIVDKVRSEKAA